jgi:fimbrial chaperone protein
MIARSGWITRSACFGAMLFVLGALRPCESSTFSIAPIRVELSGSQSMEVLTVRNDGDAPIVIQARAMAWTQEDGVDSFVETHEVLVAPPVLTVPAQGSQIVRVALRRPADAGRELSYRLFLREVPQATAQAERGLTVALQMSLPVFIAPEQPEPTPRIEWRGRWHDDGTLELNALNLGQQHLQLFNMRLELGTSQREVDVRPNRYVLAGAQGSWLVKPPGDLRREGSILVHGDSDRGEFSAPVALPLP